MLMFRDITGLEEIKCNLQKWYLVVQIQMMIIQVKRDS